MSAGGQINVPQSMADTGPSILQVANAISEELLNLKTTLAPYVNAVDWQGTANESYAALQMQWDSAANDLMSTVGTLGALGNAVVTNWGNNLTTESTNTRIWQP